MHWSCDSGPGGGPSSKQRSICGIARLALPAGIALAGCFAAPTDYSSRCDSNEQCEDGQVCNTRTGACTNLCISDKQCGETEICSGYCIDFTRSCAEREDCLAGTYCFDGSCARLRVLGSECSDAESCASGLCVDGVCCNSPCEGSCKACLGAATGMPDGLCSAVSLGQDSADECPGQLACDGQGHCFALAGGAACPGDFACERGKCAEGICVACGDGLTGPGEDCDDGNTTDDGNGCDAACRSNGTCGNSIVDVAVEECDDGNLAPDDGCAADCSVETGWSCEGSPSRCARVVYVSQAAAPGGDGTSWEKAYSSLRLALTSLAGDATAHEYWVAGGVYYPGTSRTDSLVLRAKDRVYGGFAGVEVLRTDRDPAAHPTVLSGDIDQNDSEEGRGGNSYHIMMVEAGEGRAVIDGLQFTAGFGNGAGSLGKGGALFIAGGRPLVANCLFEGNSARSGGGIYNDGGSPTIERCEFRENVASGGDGGAIGSSGEAPVIRQCSFVGNSAAGKGGALWLMDTESLVEDCGFEDNAAGSGGAVWAQKLVLSRGRFERNAGAKGGALYVGASANVSGCVMEANWAAGGGAIALAGAELRVSDSTLLENRATWTGGGAILANDAVSLVLANCTFLQNSAADSTLGWGGALSFHGESSSATLLDSRFEGNTSQASGGAISSAGAVNIVRCWFLRNGCDRAGCKAVEANALSVESSLFAYNACAATGDPPFGHILPHNIRNSAFFGNSSATGVGGLMLATASTVTACTIAYNSGSGAGGIYVVNGATIRDTVVWGNTAAGVSSQIKDDSATALVSYSCVQGGFAGTQNLAEDPLFVSPETGDLRLLPASPLIDQGDLTGMTWDKDLQGAPRVHNGKVDIGAYEWNP